MSITGGAFFGKQLPPKGQEDPKKIIRQNCLVWGEARRDAEELVIHNHMVRFILKYGEEPVSYPPGYQRKRGEKLHRPKYMFCKVGGDHACATVMKAVEKGDMVMCLGRTAYQEFTNRNGEVHHRYDMNVDIVIPFDAIDFLMRLYNVGTLQKMLQDWDNAAPDVFESEVEE